MIEVMQPDDDTYIRVYRYKIIYDFDEIIDTLVSVNFCSIFGSSVWHINERNFGKCFLSEFYPYFFSHLFFKICIFFCFFAPGDVFDG